MPVLVQPVATGEYWTASTESGTRAHDRVVAMARRNPKWAQRIVVCVSHDRAFLDDVTTDQLHISGAARRLTQERGNYSMVSSA
jgi:hypothetical protein